MDGGDHVWNELTFVERIEFYAGRRMRQAKRTTKARPHFRRRRFRLARRAKKKFACPFVHRKFTVHPQVFHT
jgi:hypothetical protein